MPLNSPIIITNFWFAYWNIVFLISQTSTSHHILEHLNPKSTLWTTILDKLNRKLRPTNPSHQIKDVKVAYFGLHTASSFKNNRTVCCSWTFVYSRLKGNLSGLLHFTGILFSGINVTATWVGDRHQLSYFNKHISILWSEIQNFTATGCTS